MDSGMSNKILMEIRALQEATDKLRVERLLNKAIVEIRVLWENTRKFRA